MVTAIKSIWNTVSEAGVYSVHTQLEKKNLRNINRAWLILVIVQSVTFASHIIHGLYETATVTGAFIAGLLASHLFTRKGMVDAAKICVIAVTNYSTIMMAVLMGASTHIIDFLLLTALMPLYLFETRKRTIIFGGMALSVIPYIIYQFAAPYLHAFEIDAATQAEVAKTTAWVMIACLCVLLFIMYQKNAAYEKETHENEMQLREQKQLYERILEQIPIDIVTFDRNLRYTYINSAAVRDPEMRKWMIGKTNIEYVSERNLDASLAVERDRILHEALEKETKIEIEETFVNRFGRSINTIKGVSPVYSDEGTGKQELLCLIGYSLDVTAMKDAEGKVRAYATELERKNEDLQHFVNATSHDLKSPLRNIASHLQLLEKRNREKLDADSLAMIDYTVAAVKQLNQLINDIYQYSVADRHDKPVEETDLNQVLAKVLTDYNHVFADKNARIEYGHLPQLKVAPAHMGMLFTNLLGNAVKYNNAATPTVSINCMQTETEYVISVADNGIGIPADYKKQVFEIFRRLHTIDVYEGTGVGLAICKKIVENYGGRIWVESEEGQGSEFYFTVPKNAGETHIRRHNYASA